MAAGTLSNAGREQARRLGMRPQQVFTSDLRRAVETANLAFAGTHLPILHDWRLRECEYGQCNDVPVHELHSNPGLNLEEPYPGGESWNQAVIHVGRFLDDLPLRWDGSRVVVIGHTATRWAFDHFLNGMHSMALVHAEFPVAGGLGVHAIERRRTRHTPGDL